MTARSPDDSAGEHNNGSGWTANLPSEGGSNETEWSEVSLCVAVNEVCGYVRGPCDGLHNPNVSEPGKEANATKCSVMDDD